MPPQRTSRGQVAKVHHVSGYRRMRPGGGRGRGRPHAPAPRGTISRLRGGVLSKARRGELITPLPVGLAYDAAGHVILDPDAAVRGALEYLFAAFEATGSATACVKAFRAAGLSFPWRHLKGPRKGETDWKPLAHHTVLRVLHNPRYAGAFTYGRHAHHKQPNGKTTSRMLPRQEWISFIPGVHPGYITLEQYDANLARLTANAAAHGRDRAAGPPREGPALLQGIIICGRCGLRMTVRYHRRRGTSGPPTSASATASKTPAASAPPSPAPAWTRPPASCSSPRSPR